MWVGFVDVVWILCSTVFLWCLLMLFTLGVLLCRVDLLFCFVLDVNLLFLMFFDGCWIRLGLLVCAVGMLIKLEFAFVLELVFILLVHFVDCYVVLYMVCLLWVGFWFTGLIR